ncbi:MAG: HAMP domain-containing histidine kinase [Lachnospiraceae bacterium]|nr:HAMP domain-containing histidine kinase [Bacteroidaceae bacterium]MBQ8640108.1 HAMP domain-containing histidine kinase [Lachnospiraceae bacterium]
MIKKLRIKFICVIMAIVMVLLGTILGVVIHFTGQNMEMQSISMMRRIADRPFQLDNLGKPRDDEVRLPFFTVQLGPRGELIAASGGYFDLSDWNYIQEIVNGALLSDTESGKLNEHNLRYLKSVSPRGYTIVFSDTTTETATLKNMVYSCLAVFFGAMAVFLGISIFLSRWVIRPVEQAWDQQRQFVADASHELKTPLAVIMANAELIQNEDTSETDRRSFSQNILSMTYQMRSLVENMLEMARVDNGTLKMKFYPVDFSQLVSDAALSFQLLFEEKGMGLQYAVQDGISLNGSEQHLYQLLDVLLDNALKYSSPCGTVHIQLNQSGRNCILSVSSPGEPISREDQKNIFKRFYRADKARAMNGSYGLGLAIAESIVEAHKGKIWTESANGYNTFFVLFASVSAESGIHI